MNLPNYELASIDEEKICEYLLSPTHPVGKAKAAWFGKFGYTQSNWELLRTDLLEIACGEAELLENSRYGQKYGISGKLVGPNGKYGQVMTIWISLSGHEHPRLVTAYPDE